jgi:hypothetical protein
VATEDLTTATYSGERRSENSYIQRRQEIWQQLHTVATGDLTTAAVATGDLTTAAVATGDLTTATVATGDLTTATYNGDRKSDNTYIQWLEEI